MRIQFLSLLAVGCLTMTTMKINAEDKNFGEDVEYLSKYNETIVLGGKEGGPMVAVVPAYQGRVMTSSTSGKDGNSFGYLKYDHIAAGKFVPHINVFGGEDRFWLGPEGGQYSVYFKPGTEFEFENWQTPPLIDTDVYKVVDKNDSMVRFKHEAKVQNHSGTNFDLTIDRTVKLLTDSEIQSDLGIDLKGVEAVGYATDNKITNTGDEAWTEEKGLLSIWILGMMKHSDKLTVVIPFNEGEASEMGPAVIDDYFGKVPADRLKVADGVAYFKGDGKMRTKIGLNPKRSKDVCGSYDAERKVLTIVKFTKPGPDVTKYVNSAWKLQEKPFAGDVINSYNDGPNNGNVLGPFYELETSSPAFALKPGESGQHVSKTYHIEGSEEALDAISKKVFGVGLADIKGALE